MDHSFVIHQTTLRYEYVYVRFIIWFVVVICLECQLGYYLNNCSKKCRPPNYGEECQYVCQCPNKDCHFATGCPPRLETVTVYQHLSIVIYIMFLSYWIFLWTLWKQRVVKIPRLVGLQSLKKKKWKRKIC